MLEDYRTGLTVDRDDEEADRAAGRTLAMPTPLVVSAHQDMRDLGGDPLAVWQTWADNVALQYVDATHHMAEQASPELSRILEEFFA